MENAEINNIIKILGLQYKKNYSDPESLKTLRYGKIMIMTDQVCQQLRSQKCILFCLFIFFISIENMSNLIWKVYWFWSFAKYHLTSQSLLLWQDQDGSHIKGLLINFIHHNWPALLKHSFLEEFITPIIKVLTPTRRLKAEDILHFHCSQAFRPARVYLCARRSWRIVECFEFMAQKKVSFAWYKFWILILQWCCHLVPA